MENKYDNKNNVIINPCEKKKCLTLGLKEGFRE